MKRIINTVILVMIWISAVPQSSDQNYILTRTYIKSGAEYIDQIRYYDGLGRPVQTVQKGVTPQGGDLATYAEYDSAGREWKQHLPVKGSGNGAFVPLADFSGSSLYGGDGRAYAETVYEPSPLNRITAQKGPGAAWEAHPVTTTYDTNGGEVKCFYVSEAGSVVQGANYSAGTLYKTETKDEDNKSVVEYTDKLGRVVMQRRGGNADTYYVYNDLGQLAFVLPPLAADANGSADAVDKYGYVYKYDKRGNCTYKKLPGCEPVYMVYDKADRLIASQDGSQRVQDQWTITKYDMLGRVIYTALLIRDNTLEQMENTLNPLLIVEQFDGSSSFFGTGYSCGYFTNELTPLTVYYYDSYTFRKLQTAVPDTTKLNYLDRTPDGYTSQYTPPTGVRGAAGLLTGTRTYLLDGSGRYTVSVMYYDHRGNVVQSRSTNHLGGYDIVYHDLDFTGKPNKTLKEHNIAGQSIISELYTYTYDHAGRNTKTIYQLNNQTAVTLTDMTESGSYDEPGRLRKKKRHNGEDSEEYDYNIRNWATRIKSGEFEENLYYNSIYNSYATAYYNGNISYSTWTYGGSRKAYVYRYNELNRLTSGIAYQTSGSTLYAPASSEQFSYDKHGNITSLARMKEYTTVDAMHNISYEGNQLKAIHDYAGSQNQYAVKEYQNKSNTQDEFSYDANGNMTKDLDRDIVTIRYNLLNLPDTVQFKNGNQIINLYDAGGRKLYTRYYTILYPEAVPVISTLAPGKTIKLVYNMDIVDETGTFYVDNFEYGFNGCDPGWYWMEKVYNPEGYSEIAYTTIRYNYYRKDHLGNNREVWRAPYTYNYTNEFYPAATIQRTQYYPSGLPWAEGTGAEVQQKKYNGKEWIEAHGLDEYDSQARMYYPAIMRTTTIDPLAEKYYSISPYAWCGNNPVNRIDPDGMDDYKINSDGRIWFWRETEDETDRLIAIGNKNVVYVDKTGKILNNNITITDTSILPSLSKTNTNDESYATTNSKEVGGLFLFVAKNSNKEWDLGGFKDGKGNAQYFLGTSHSDSYSVTGNSSGLFNENNKLFEVHSHARENSAKGASSIMITLNGEKGYIDCDMGDINRDYQRRMDTNTLPQPPHYVYHKYSQNLYNYTPWESSIYVKKANTANTANSLNFLLRLK